MNELCLSEQLGECTYKTAIEVADILGISRQRVFVLCREGRFNGAYKEDDGWGQWKIPIAALKKEVRLKNGRPKNIA